MTIGRVSRSAQVCLATSALVQAMAPLIVTDSQGSRMCIAHRTRS